MESRSGQKEGAWRRMSSPPLRRLDEEGSFAGSLRSVIKAKRSGVQNLKRDGWSEDKCRAFLVKNTQFIPRNYNYADGMRLIYPLLQYAFGDENLDCSAAILWEFIEIERDPPYPEALFQKWKFHHAHRHEDLSLPHVPHANTISLPVVVTDRLRQWREQQSNLNSTELAIEPAISRPGGHEASQRLPDHIPASAYKKLYPNWREDAIHISAGGQTATPYLPKQEVRHKRIWDEQHGRGGKLQSTKSVTVEDLIKEKVVQTEPEGKASDASTRRSISQHLKINIRKKLASFKVFRQTISDENGDTTQLSFGELVPLEIPNANFARKFALIPPEQPLGGHRILEQKTACQKQIESDQALWDKALKAARDCRAGPSGIEISAGKLFSDATSNYHRQPLTPSLFYDSWNDFNFGSDEDAESTDLEEPGDTHSLQSMPIFGQEADFSISLSLGEIEPQITDFTRKAITSHDDSNRLKLVSPKPVESTGLISDLPLRKFAGLLEPRTMRTEFLLDGGGDIVLTLPATTFDPIHVRAVYTIDTFQPTTSLLEIFGCPETDADQNPCELLVNNIPPESKWKSPPRHGRSSTCCSAITQAIPPQIDTPPFTPLTPPLPPIRCPTFQVPMVELLPQARSAMFAFEQNLV